MATRADRLREIRRRLGIYTQLQSSNEAYVLNDAEIARRLSELIVVVIELAEAFERSPNP